MPRSLVGVALALLALAPAAPAQMQGFAPRNPPGMTAPGPATNVGTCSGCYRELQWSGTSANAPKKCPHCGVGFNFVENDDGTRTRIAGTSGDSGSGFHSFRGAGKLVGFAVFVVCLVVGGLIKLGGLLFSGGSSRPKRRKAKKRRPAAEDDDEGDAPPRRRDRPRADGKPVPMAALADDDAGFEVVGDIPPAAPEPPRRAKARLIPPGGAP